MSFNRMGCRLGVCLTVAVLAACGGDSSNGPPDSTLLTQADELFPAGATRTQAEVLVAGLEAAAAANDDATADAKAFALASLTLEQYHAVALAPSAAQLPPRLKTFLTGAFTAAGLPAPPLTNASFGDDGVVAVVGTTGGTFATTTKHAGISIPAGAASRQTLLVVDRLPDSSSYAPKRGPLPTALDQYPLFYEFTLTPTITLGDDALLGLCQVSDPASAFYPSDAVFAQLQIAHPDPGDRTTIELLPRVDAPPFLDCSSVTASAARNGAPGVAKALARVGGIGGRVRKFSPFAAVNPAPATVRITPPASTILINGVTLQLTAQVLDAAGHVITGAAIDEWRTSDPVLATVDAKGLVTTLLTGTVSITARSGAIVSDPLVLLINPIAPPRLELVVDALDTARTYEPLGRAPQVRVRDATFSPQPGVTVTASIDAGPAIITAGATAVTDAQGIATFSNLALGLAPVVDGFAFGSIRFDYGGLPPVYTQDVFIYCSLTPLALGTSLSAELRPGDCRESDGRYLRYFAIDVTAAQAGPWRFANTTVSAGPIIGQSGPFDLLYWLGFGAASPGTRYLHAFLIPGRNYLVAESNAPGPITVATVPWNGVVDCFASGQVGGPRVATLTLTEALSNQYSCTFGSDQRYVSYQMILLKNYQLQVRVTSTAFTPTIDLYRFANPSNQLLTSNTAAASVAEVTFINSTLDADFLTWSVSNPVNPTPGQPNPAVGNYTIEITTTPLGPVMQPGLRTASPLEMIGRGRFRTGGMTSPRGN